MYAAAILLAGPVAQFARAEGVMASWDQLNERQRRMFRDMPDKEVAKFFVHPYQPTTNAAAHVLARRGPRVAPLMIRLLSDGIAGLRLGAVKTLGQLYAHNGETFRTKVSDPALAKAIAAIRPLIDDPDNDVRRAVIGFVKSVQVDNPDTRYVLRKIAQTPDVGTLAAVQSLLRYQIQDPALRIELARLSAETLVDMPTANPGSFKVLQICSSAHLDACRELVGVSIRFLDKRCLPMWGMFSNSPSVASMEICERFSDDPRVRKALPVLLRVYTRKVGGKNEYWTHLQEGPRRVLLRIGPDAAGVLREFLASERKLFAKYASGEATPVNKWDQLRPGCDLRFEELADVAALMPALHGPMPVDKAIPLMCRIYLERDWSEDERQMIRDRFAALGPDAAALVRRQVAEIAAAARKRIEQRLAQWQGVEDTAEQRRLQREVKPLAEHVERIDGLAAELTDLAAMIDLLAQEKPTPAGAETLCRLYVRRAWPQQRAAIRDVLQKWGPATAAEVHKFVKADRPYFEQRMAEFAQDEAHCRATQRMGRGLETSLIRLDLARVDLADDFAALSDLALVIDKSAAGAPSKADAAELCRIYTHRGWARQNGAIAAALRRGGPGITDVIEAAVKQAQADLADAVEKKLSYMSNTVKSRFKWRYDRACALEADLTKGIAGLKALARPVSQK